MAQLGPVLRGREFPVLRRTIPWATQWGQLDGSQGTFGGFGPGGGSGRVLGFGPRPDLLTSSDTS